MKLAYKAFDKSGREVTDVIEAAGVAEATEKLRRQNLFVAEISESRSEAPEKAGPKRVRLWGGKTRRLKNLAMFTRQFYVLVHSGAPIAQALTALERQARDQGWRDVIREVRTRLEHGLSLSEAMAAHPKCFDSVYRNVIAAGESGGNLPIMLDRLAGLTQKRLHIRSSVLSALIYPCLLLMVAATVLTTMMLFVIPRFAELFGTLDVPLPPTTGVLIALSTLLRTYGWAFGLGIVGLVGGLTYYLKTPAGRRTVDTVVLRLPRMGRIVRSFATARITRLLGVLLESHLPVLEALKLTRAASANSHYSDLMARTEDAVARGETISSTFLDSDLISPSVYEAIRSGEKSGQVGPMLLNMADFLDEENDVVLRSLTSILEPAILILMGLVVGFVAISMFMPLFDVTAMIGGGAG